MLVVRLYEIFDYQYTIIDFIEVGMRIYLLEKVIFPKAPRPRQISLLRVDKSFYLLKSKSITILLYDFSTANQNFFTFTFVVEVMFNEDFLTSFNNIISVIKKYVVFCILKCMSPCAI